MFDLGTQELIVIFIVAFLVFGPKKLPELGRTLGKGVREIKAAMRGVKESFEEAEEGVTDEVKQVKHDLEDSIYKSIEPNLQKTGEETKEVKAGKEGKDKPAATAEKDDGEEKSKKETEKDG